MQLDSQVSEIEQQVASFAIIFPGLLSMISTFIVFARYIYRKDLQNVLMNIFSQQFEFFMIVTLCIGDFLQASSITLPAIYFWANDLKSYDNYAYCTVQGFFQELGCLMQFIWTSNIAYSAYRGLTSESDEQIKRRKLLICILGFGIPLLFALMQSYIANSPIDLYDTTEDGLSNSTCFITGQIEVFFLFYLPLILCLCFNIFFYGLISKELSKIVAVNVWDKELMMYPMILIFCQGWFCLYYIIYSISHVEWYYYQIWCLFTSNLTGFLDGVAYGLNLKQIGDDGVLVSAYSVLTMQRSTQLLQKDVEM